METILADVTRRQSRCARVGQRHVPFVVRGLAGGPDKNPACAGKTRPQFRQHVLHRNNPACAGKTRLVGVGYAACREQPRVRGENVRRWLALRCPQGTTPRARGKQLFALAVEALGGEQPRVRGENKAFVRLQSLLEGTTPRARGKHFITCGFGAALLSFHSTCNHNDTSPDGRDATRKTARPLIRLAA